MKTIAVLTATRAEFGLLKPLILRLIHENFCQVDILVTGMHLSAYYGDTYREIEAAGIPIKVKIDMHLESDTPLAISQSMATAIIEFGRYFSSHKPDLLVVLGDRYETLAVCMSAMSAEIPIAHIAGGELTEGLIDEAIRHSITKMSHLHFVSTEIYRRRVIQLGEHPDNVYNVGAFAVENTKNTNFLSKTELEESIGHVLKDKYCVVTFHPVTLEDHTAESQIKELLGAVEAFPNISFLFTKANADMGGRIINQYIDGYANTHDNAVSVSSLGVRRYLSAVKGCEFVLGNSSSGLMEAPCLSVPTVNIGDRQKGRLMPESVICCGTDKNSIKNAMIKAMSPEFKNRIKYMVNPFGDGRTSVQITNILRERLVSDTIHLKKEFYDL